MHNEHRYEVTVTWTGNRGEGTASYRSYDRDNDIETEHHPVIQGSADPHFRGNPSRWNPEQLLVAAAAQCHMLAYLHVAATNNLIVTAYVDHPTAVLTEDDKGGGAFTDITLHPTVTITDPDQIELAARLHHDANAACFIANSLNLPVRHEPSTVVRI